MNEYYVKYEVDKRLVLGMFQAHATRDQQSRERPNRGNEDRIDYEESQASQLDI